MGLIQRAWPWTEQPQTCTAANQKWVDAGLSALFDCRSGVEVIGGARASVDGLTRLPSLAGVGADFSSAPMRFAHRASYAITGPIWIFVYCDIDALTSYGALVAKQATTTTNAPYELRLGTASTGSDINFGRADAASIASRNAGSTIAAGSKSVRIILTATGKDPLGTVWVNGNPFPLYGAGTGSPTDSVSSDVWIGRRYDSATQLDGRIFTVALGRGILPESLALELDRSPWDLFEPRRIIVPVSVAGAGDTAAITAAAGAATASSLAGAATAAAAITQAAGAATASTVGGASTAASAITSAAGAATASTLPGAAAAASTITAAAGAATASTVAATSTAAAAITQAAGTSTAGTLTGVAGSGSTITAAAGSATASTLAGSSAAASAITAASGAATASTAAGASTAAATITAAAGAATAATLTGSTAGDASAITPAAGASSAQIIVGASFAQAAMTAAAGSSTASTMAPVGSFVEGNPRVWLVDARSHYTAIDARNRVAHLS